MTQAPPPSRSGSLFAAQRIRAAEVSGRRRLPPGGLRLCPSFTTSPQSRPSVDVESAEQRRYRLALVTAGIAPEVVAFAMDGGEI
ncbi:hypothetical protein AAHA92_22570 [Salvia divinorum]|uniref:Uncharacterized protein n=1 Tax=Salvia divinorum TaxID=28513 RepID=A0ABD1GME7_SALDI